MSAPTIDVVAISTQLMQDCDDKSNQPTNQRSSHSGPTTATSVTRPRHVHVDHHAQLNTFSSTNQTGGNSRKLDKSHISSARDFHCFSKGIINVWDSLPDYIAVSKTVNTFEYKTNKLHVLRIICWFI